jgi:hypothetical protein
VDNILVFCRANPDHLHYLCALFLRVEVVFGFSINLANSELDPVGNVNNADGLADILALGFRLYLWNILVFCLKPLLRPNL